MLNKFAISRFLPATQSPDKEFSVLPAGSVKPVQQKGSWGVILTFSQIAMAAKLCMVDGYVNEREMQSYEILFPMNGESQEKRRALFMDACSETLGLRHFTHQARKMLEIMDIDPVQTMQMMIKIADSDGIINTAEERSLIEIAEAMSFSSEKLRLLIKRYYFPDFDQDSRALLGISRWAGIKEIKRAYRDKTLQFHPDKFLKPNTGRITMELFNQRFSLLNDAYKSLVG
jgi:DnaJ-domain-containing protein 1